MGTTSTHTFSWSAEGNQDEGGGGGLAPVCWGLCAPPLHHRTRPHGSGSTDTLTRHNCLGVRRHVDASRAVCRLICRANISPENFYGHRTMFTPKFTSLAVRAVPVALRAPTSSLVRVLDSFVPIVSRDPAFAAPLSAIRWLTTAKASFRVRRAVVKNDTIPYDSVALIGLDDKPIGEPAVSHGFLHHSPQRVVSCAMTLRGRLPCRDHVEEGRAGHCL